MLNQQPQHVPPETGTAPSAESVTAAESPTALARVRTTLTSPYIRWLPGFRSGVWWKWIIASAFYLIVLVNIAIDLVRGQPSGAVGYVILAGLVIAGVYAYPYLYARWAAERRSTLIEFRVENAVLFPGARYKLTEDNVREPWPRLLTRAHKRHEHIVFVPVDRPAVVPGGVGGPAAQEQVSEFATEAIVRGVSPYFEFEGLRRVHIVKTFMPQTSASKGQSSNGPLAWARRFWWVIALAVLILPIVTVPILLVVGGWMWYTGRLTASGAGVPLIRCRFVLPEDGAEPAANEEMRQLGETIRAEYLAWVQDNPDRERLAREIEVVTDPVLICNRVAQIVANSLAVEEGQVFGAVALLKANDLVRMRALVRGLRAMRGGSGGASGRSNQEGDFTVELPASLPTLADVGGMDDLKRQIREVVGTLVQQRDAVKALDIKTNGILLYGPPGTGKTLAARATAGEYKLRFISVSSDLNAGIIGEAGERIRAAFATAARNRPCVLFFDEFDSIASKRGDGGNEMYTKQVVGQLLRSLEDIRRTPGVIVMAATNDVESLDPAVVRPGRFDTRIRVDKPDAEARKAILETLLAKLPTAGQFDLGSLVAQTEGRGAADLTALVEGAKMKALYRTARSGTDAAPQITQADLENALREGRGKDAAAVEKLTWDDLILPEETKDQLKKLAQRIVDPLPALRMGIKPPTGALLYGPPGTGKTTIARVLAAETRGGVSFIQKTGSELKSKYAGESAKKVRELFERARASSPTIVFIDEIEALLPTRDTGERGVADPEGEAVVTEFLQQMDGFASTPGVFVLGATNHKDTIDPAILRGGRLSPHIEIPLPGREQRQALFHLYMKKIALADDVDLAALARQSERQSPADIRALCEEAARRALDRDAAAVTQDDFLAVLRAGRSVTPGIERRGWDELILPERTITELKSLTRLIADPEVGRDFGIKRPTGAVLYGPPGTGKTTIAQVIASQVAGDVSFVVAKGSELKSQWKNESAKKVRELFDRARAQTPAIIFIDEIESILPVRGVGMGTGGDREDEAVVTEFLQQLDGIDSTPGVFVLGATNHLEMVDPAVLRGGRLGRKIEIPLPGFKEREALFTLHSRTLRLGGVDLAALAAQSDGWSGADIEAACADAAEHAFAREDGPRAVTQADFLSVLAQTQVQRRSGAHWP